MEVFPLFGLSRFFCFTRLTNDNPDTYHQVGTKTQVFNTREK